MNTKIQFILKHLLFNSFSSLCVSSLHTRDQRLALGSNKAFSSTSSAGVVTQYCFSAFDRVRLAQSIGRFLTINNRESTALAHLLVSVSRQKVLTFADYEGVFRRSPFTDTCQYPKNRSKMIPNISREIVSRLVDVRQRVSIFDSHTVLFPIAHTKASAPVFLLHDFYKNIQRKIFINLPLKLLALKRCNFFESNLR